MVTASIRFARFSMAALLAALRVSSHKIALRPAVRAPVRCLALATASHKIALRPAVRAPVRCFALPTAEEMSPGSPEMKARAGAARDKYADKVLDPEAASLFAIEQRAKIIDVRTAAERARHEINGVAGVTIRGALSCPLNDMVSGELPVPSGPLLLTCSKGPKSLVALDHLLGELGMREDIRLVDGGATAWDSAGLPTESVV